MVSQSQRGPQLPLFYREPQPLSSQIHADWRLKEGDAGFTKDTPYVPIVVREFAAASRNYPIVFAAGDAAPLAILGLERANLFVDAGRWVEDAYVPAYVRRYPFGFGATTDPEGFALMIDAGSDRIGKVGDDGAALFVDGQPSSLTQQALAFCDAFQADARSTAAFSAALRANELLTERRADATLPNGRKLGLNGFEIVDAEKFAALEDTTIAAWHRSGWLALVHFHLASLDRFSVLLARQGARGRASEATASGPAAAIGATAPSKSTKKA